jgi:hypothetical protein
VEKKMPLELEDCKVTRRRVTFEHFHQHGEISRVAKVFTKDSKPTSDPGHYARLQQLFPHPSADYDSPLQMGEDLQQHWPSELR